ncbi:hypothetical protein BD410DRAFT_731278 [Rickenella mellea]|uniref:DNA breaking-rejoining enzyme n=1 Tax=Rickenella mellea TaxID=50990 RepID=A0A4Y7PPV8_9AGAM|nr:hypothetical protein BD410DRAFT_731278 [Rickenella mellea]
MCPVLAWCTWWKIFEGDRFGFVFRKRLGYDRVSINADEALSSDAFMEAFRNNLLDISINPRPYGTHSFRRGGCQYLCMELRWPIRNICTWGGWADNFDNPGTIFKYLLSWTDAPTVQREDYFNPKRQAADPCYLCGRTCHCS